MKGLEVLYPHVPAALHLPLSLFLFYKSLPVFIYTPGQTKALWAYCVAHVVNTLTGPGLEPQTLDQGDDALQIIALVISHNEDAITIQF